MALSDFFRINLPYGLTKNLKGEWFAFNREYKPLGWNTTDHVNEEEFPIYTKYKGLTEKRILKIITENERIHRDQNGNIFRFYLYNDGTNPQSSPTHWKKYFEMIKELSKLEVAE
jgi:hypothetical protein